MMLSLLSLGKVLLANPDTSYYLQAPSCVGLLFIVGSMSYKTCTFHKSQHDQHACVCRVLAECPSTNSVVVLCRHCVGRTTQITINDIARDPRMQCAYDS